jgi:hypothetical protein
MEKVGLLEFLDLLNSASIFKRGLPETSDLKDLATARVFSLVLCHGVVEKSDLTSDEHSEWGALQRCFHNGWLHADNVEVNNLDEIGYVFPSPLHRWFVEWKISDAVQAVPFEADDILKFVIDVISNFNPQLLSAERRIGPGCVQRPPEAQYQDEFYRCCHKCSNGSLKTFPEFGSANGRADFYIPAKEWGVELYRNGDRLTEHSGRFSSGAYQGDLSLDRYIILDCRDTRPKRPRGYVHLFFVGHFRLFSFADLGNLYHVVFSNNFQEVSILNNALEVVDGGELRLSDGDQTGFMHKKIVLYEY